MNAGLIVLAVACLVVVLAFRVRWLVAGAPVRPDTSGPYPNGSVPYGPPESPSLRARRFLCASVNHHPRFPDGSWCFGYNYVCGRCHMYADPWGKKHTDAIMKSLGDNPDRMDVARACGEGPPR